MRAVVVAVLCMVGCYSPHYGDCEVSCASNVCPSGLECREGMCRVAGGSGACSSITPDAGDDGIPIEMLYDRQIDAVCTYLARCGVFEDATTCRENLGVSMVSPGLIEAVAAGKIHYDGIKARECIDAMAANTCERARSFTRRDAPLACDGVFSGTLTDGAECFLGEECVSMTCKIQDCNMGCCAGMCVGNSPPGRPALGQPCTPSDRCVNGYCPGTGNALCTAFKNEDVTCANSEECMPGLSCLQVGTDPTMMTCRAPKPTLGVCSTTAECAVLADTCRGGVCQTGGLTGTVCSKVDECQLNHPCSGSTQGMCRLLPTVGESCSFYPVCRDGVCNPQGMCVAKVPNGGPCDAASGVFQCESGYCDTSIGQCAAQPVCF